MSRTEKLRKILRSVNRGLRLTVNCEGAGWHIKEKTGKARTLATLLPKELDWLDAEGVKALLAKKISALE